MKRDPKLKEYKIDIDKHINSILDYLKRGAKNQPPPLNDMETYTAVHMIADKGDKESAELLSYHNKIIENFLLDLNKELIVKTNINYIDEFLILEEKINTLIYMMNRLFTYLDRFYMKVNVKKTLSQIEMEIYKTIFFEHIKKNVYIEIYKLINDERKGNKELRPKIKKILNIIKCFEFDKPKIIKDEKSNQIQWIDEGNSDFPKDSSTV